MLLARLPFLSQAMRRRSPRTICISSAMWLLMLIIFVFSLSAALGTYLLATVFFYCVVELGFATFVFFPCVGVDDKIYPSFTIAALALFKWRPAVGASLPETLLAHYAKILSVSHSSAMTTHTHTAPMALSFNSSFTGA